MSCDDDCCNHGCNQGHNCPARCTPASMLSPGELPNPTGPPVEEPSPSTVFAAIAYVALAYVLAVFVAPFLGGWWHP